MKDEARTKKDLINELVALRRRVSVVEEGGPQNTLVSQVLRETGEEYRDVVDHISDGVFSFNRDGYFTFVN
ncbi:MAG: hypothetical protein JRD43_06635, partial [Deltaproteobacteria bacterium]|nr:hypothetical protein [Deltaproteobacteria bacterium]